MNPQEPVNEPHGKGDASGCRPRGSRDAALPVVGTEDSRSRRPANKREYRLQATFALITCGIVSGSYYYASLLPSLESDPSLKWDMHFTTFINTYATAAETLGLIITGPLADCIAADGIVYVQASLVCFAILLVSLSRNSSTISVIFFVVLFSKGTMWPMLGSSISANLPAFKHDATFILTATASRFGDFFSAIVLGFLMDEMECGWRHSLAIFLLLVMCLFFTAHLVRPRILAGPGDTEPSVGSSIEKLGRLLRCCDAWLTFLTLVGSYLCWGLGTYAPVLLHDIFQLSPGKAAALSALIPFGSLSGLFVGYFTSAVFEVRTARVLHVVQGLIGSLALYTITLIPQSLAGTLSCVTVGAFGCVILSYLPYLAYSASSLPSERAFRLAFLDAASSLPYMYSIHVFGRMRETTPGVEVLSKIASISATGMLIACATSALLYMRIRAPSDGEAEFQASDTDDGSRGPSQQQPSLVA